MNPQEFSRLRKYYYASTNSPIQYHNTPSRRVMKNKRFSVQTKAEYELARRKPIMKA